MQKYYLQDGRIEENSIAVFDLKQRLIKKEYEN